MDFASLKNNALYGPMRIVVAAFLVYASHKGWIPQNVIDPDLLTVVLLGGLVTWSIWQQNHSAKKADLVTAVAVKSTVMSQAPVTTPLSQAEQKAIVVGAKAAVKHLPEHEITEALNASQTGDKP